MALQSSSHLLTLVNVEISIDPCSGGKDPLEKEMVTHSSILAWRIAWNEEPGGLQSMGSQRVGHY